FSSRRRHTRSKRDWSSDVCSSDLSATDYAILQNEANVNGGQAPIYADPYNLIDANGNSIKGFGTDWQDLVFYDNAPVVNHDVTRSEERRVGKECGSRAGSDVVQ